MNDIQISVCIPTYNQTKYLKKTIDSILLQKNVRFELIISDDSSTDDVKLLIDNYVFGSIPVTYVRNFPSLGSPENWNHSISMAKGEWIKIMHHDDWFCEKNALEKILDVASKNPNSLIFAGIKGQFANESRSYVNLPVQSKLKALQQDPFSLLWANVIGPPSTILFPRMLITFDQQLVWLVDIEFYLQLLITNKLKLCYVEEVLFENSPDEHNITNQCFQNKELELNEFIYIFKKYFKKPTLMELYRFLRLLKRQISTYDKITYFEIIMFYYKSNKW